MALIPCDSNKVIGPGQSGGGGVTPADAFTKYSQISGTQKGEATRKLLHKISQNAGYPCLSITVASSGIVYVCTTTYRLLSFKLENDKLTLIQNLNLLTPGLSGARTIKAVGSNLYLFDSEPNSKVLKIDISNPAGMFYVDTYDPGIVASIEPTEEYLFVAVNSPYEIRVLNAKTFEIISTFTNPNLYEAREMYIIDDFLFALSIGTTGQNARLFIINKSNPFNLKTQGSIELTDFPFGTGEAFALKVNNEKAYVVGQNTYVNIIDVSNKTNPSLLSSSRVRLITARINNIEIAGDYMVGVINDTDELFLYNVADPLNPFLVETTSTNADMNNPRTLSIVGNTALVVSSDSNYITLWDINGYYMSTFETGNMTIKGKTIMFDDVKISRNLDTWGWGSFNGVFVKNNILAKNLPVSQKIVRSYLDFPEVTYGYYITGDTIEFSGGIQNVSSIVGLTPGMTLVSEAFPAGTVINTVTPPSDITVSNGALGTYTGANLKVDPLYIELGNVTEYLIDDDIQCPYPLKVASSGSSGLVGLADNKYIYTGASGAAILGEIDANSFFALLGKFFISHLSPTARIFDITSDITSTIFMQNLIIFQTPPFSPQNLGTLQNMNVSTQVAQIRGWASGLTITNAFKIKMNDWSFTFGSGVGGTGLTIDGTVSNAIDIKGFDSTLASNESLFYFDPATVSTLQGKVLLNSNAAIGGSFFEAGSADEKSVKVKATACSVPDSTANSYSNALNQGGVQTELLEDQIRRINATFSSVSKERFENFPNGNEKYIGIDDFSATVHISITGLIVAGVNEVANFYIAKGNTDNTIVSFADAGGGEVLITTSQPHNLVDLDIILIEDTVNYDDDYSVTVVSSTELRITAVFVATETGTFAKILKFTKIPNKYSGDEKNTNIISQIELSKNDYIFPVVQHDNGSENWGTSDIQIVIRK
jgi:hypothetical protein